MTDKDIYGLPNEAAGYGYVNVPKVAGSSIKTAIADHMGVDWRDAFLRTHPHTRPLSYILDRRDLHWFTVVRHPCDRLVSVWTFFLTPQSRELDLEKNPDLRAMTGWSFPQFVRTVIGMSVVQMDMHYAPQTELLYHNGRPLFNQLLRLEGLREEWRGLRSRFGLPPLPHIRESTHPPWQEMFTPDLLRVVRNRYADDFEHFGYEAVL